MSGAYWMVNEGRRVGFFEVAGLWLRVWDVQAERVVGLRVEIAYKVGFCCIHNGFWLELV